MCPANRGRRKPVWQGPSRLATTALSARAFDEETALVLGAAVLGLVAGQDLNLRPSGYEPDELPGCSTPRRRAKSAEFGSQKPELRRKRFRLLISDF
jgi:hypothetical protein